MKKRKGERVLDIPGCVFMSNKQAFLSGGDGGESNSPSRRNPSRICYKLSQLFVLTHLFPADRVQIGQSIIS
jgi:hypothetical protein